MPYALSNNNCSIQLAPISIHLMPRPRCNDIELCDVWQLAQIRGAFTDLSPPCSANQCDWDSFALSGAETSEMYISCILSEKDGNSLDQSQWLYRWHNARMQFNSAYGCAQLDPDQSHNLRPTPMVL